MILLSGHSLAQARRVPMEALSLQLRERDSSATMTPADMTGIGTDSWLLDDTGPGAGIVWRVASINRNYATRTPTVQLEHLISSLRDRILFGEVNAKTITGSTTATSCTAEQAVRYILGKQGDWALGQMDYNVSNPYKFDGDTLYDALETVTASLEDAWWTYDFTVYPFRLNIIRKPSGVACEMRPGRNLTTISKSISRSGMYTRFYPIGKDDLHLSTEYVEKNADIYGVISKTETDQSKDSEAELRRWANELLERHAEPTVSVTAEGLELAEATGESLDKLTLGRICRIPLEEFGTTIEERITELSYPDKIHAPEVVRITLANNRQDVTSIIADAIKKGGGGRRGAARKDKEDHAWFEDTNDHVAMCAIGIIGKDAKGEPNWVRLSRLEVDENGIFGEVQSVQNDLVIANTRIDQNEERIQLEANKFEEGVATLTGKITVQADRITQEVTNRQNGDATLQGKITVQANRITQEVSERKSGDSELSGRITVTAREIRQEVTDTENRLSSRITVNANAITQEVSRAQGAEGTLSGRITTEADRITAEVSRAQGAESSLSGRLTITESAITQEVTNRTNADNALSGRITTQADKISLVVEEKDGQNVVKAASIVAGINDQSGSYVKIQAAKINLSGYVTASELSATQADIDNLMTGKTTASKIVCDDLRLPSGFWYHGNKYTEFYSSTESKYLLGRS